MKNIKKIKRKILKGVLNPKIFLILFGLFFSSLAFAAALTVTWEAAIIPGGNNNFSQSGNPNVPFSCKSSQNGVLLTKDRTEEPSDIAFSDDGLTVFTTNKRNAMAGVLFSQNRLSRPFDIATDKVKTDPTATCDDLDGLNVSTLSNSDLVMLLEDIDFAKDGMIFFIMDTVGVLAKFNATTPFDVDGITYSGNTIDFDDDVDSTEFSRDGSKLFTLHSTANTPLLTTYSVPGDYDIASSTQIQQVDLMDYGVIDEDGNEIGQDFEFNSNGSALFVMIRSSTVTNSFIYQFSLSKNYDISTAVKVGRFSLTNIFLKRTGNLSGDPYAFGFSGDGMKLYILDIKNGDNAPDHINQFQLECPFGVVSCVADSTASIGAQFELAKQNIKLNVSTIFKRFEWIKRNRDEENLTSHNIDLNYPNPLLRTLVKNFEPRAKKAVISLVSTSQKKKTKSKWSSWSLGDLTISDFNKHGFENAKDIRTGGLTFGTDRKFGDNKFFGFAIRYGDSETNIRQSQQNTDMESLTLNIYGIIPRDDNRYINAVLGISALRFDNKYLGKLSGERNGKQAFAALNYRTNNTYGKFNVTPSGKFTYGVTKLSEFTDFLSSTIDSPTTDVRYAEDIFRSGELAGGFLFEMEKIDFEDGSFQPMGSIEYLYDLTPINDYKYTLQGSTDVNKGIVLGKYSKESLKTNIGFEMIFLNGFTLSPSYENVKTLTRKNKDKYIERYIIKISRSKEENDSEFALNLDSLNDRPANFSYSKKLNDLFIKFTSNHNLLNKIDDYGANIEVSGIF